MPDDFYVNTGELISPGDIFNLLPHTRIPHSIKVARKLSFTLPKKNRVKTELREIFEFGKHAPTPSFKFESDGEEILAKTKMSKVIFLTWGSEVEDDERNGKLEKKHWLLAPVFSLADLEKVEHFDERSGRTIRMVDEIRQGTSSRFFPLPPVAGEESLGHYVDFRKICPLAASHFTRETRIGRLSPKALNDFYHQLIWFFTRKKMFFAPVTCENCGHKVDLDINFEGQAVNPEETQKS